MATDGKVLLDAVNALAADSEFAAVLAIADTKARKVVDYLVRRGVEETDAEFLGLAYFVGRLHEDLQIGRTLDRIGAKL